jgi:phosphoribosylformylglycinamidine synthase
LGIKKEATLPVEPEFLEEIALTEEEYELICQRLGREPTIVELGMFGGLWSEHCGYKHSKPLFHHFPTSNSRVLVTLGEENAGAVDIGDGLAVVFKVESHNHPSAIEPYEGAATGVGGIVRDIFALGARPIALLNSLRFGPLSDPRQRYLFGGVVAGIAGYGNCLGLPDVGGEVYFDRSYSGNCLVNAMCVGIVEKGKLIGQGAKGTGNTLMLVGADTGRDGIHGVSGLASRTFEDDRELRPTVQVGNPFMEKLLIEACLELADSDWIVGVQDLGGAGLTSSVTESAVKGGAGVEIDIAKVPRREAGMSPYEVMLSESQERMLVIVKAGCEEQVQAVLDKWDLHSDVIGTVTDDGNIRITDGGEVVADVPAELLTDPPLYHVANSKPDWLGRLQSQNLDEIPDMASPDVLLKLLASPNIASKEWVYRQYDYSVMTNTVVAPGMGDAAVLRVKGTNKGLAVVNDSNGRYCYLDPFTGGAIAVAEAARNIVCVGAKPLAITDCLNFGNPEHPDIYYQMEEAVKGMAAACRVLDTPVVSGNASLYNESAGTAIYPTPVIGMVGLLEDVERHCTAAFKEEGDQVLLLGGRGLWDGEKAILIGDTATLSGSEYLATVHDVVAGQPSIDLDKELTLQRLVLEAIDTGLLKSAHDCSDGGLAIALAESCILGNVGFRSHTMRTEGRTDAALFGEEQSRVVVSVAPSQVESLTSLAERHGVAVIPVGTVEGDRLSISELMDVNVSQMEAAWRNAIAEAVS